MRAKLDQQRRAGVAQVVQSESLAHAGMIPTPRLAELAALADRHQWRVVLIGDPRQLPAIGRGGMFNHLAATCDVIELDRVHRFREQWERDASLGLRRGDPDVLDLYQAHGRLHEGSATDMTRAAINDWTTHRDRGDNVIMLAVSNETVATLNTLAQQRRIVRGDIEQRFAVRGRDCQIHVGDEVVTRTNDRHLRTDHGEMVRNRARWIVASITPDGAIEAVGPDGRVTLPSSYVSTSVELGYAQTVHGAQGRTVDHALLVVDGHLDGRGLYVGMSRGARSNNAYVAVDGNRTGRDVLETAIHGDWADTPAIEVRAQLRENLEVRIEQALTPSTGRRSTARRLRDVGRRPDPADRGLGLGL